MKNCIVKIINGAPAVFGEAGKDDMDSLVYIFEEEEAFNAALDAGLIPVGTLIVKTYDEVEMAGGPFADALSDESENAVQNKVIKETVDRLDQAIADALSLRASLTEFGLGKICPVDLVDATEANGLVLGAFEKNASVAGSLANKMSQMFLVNWQNLGEHIVPANSVFDLEVNAIEINGYKPISVAGVNMNWPTCYVSDFSVNENSPYNILLRGINAGEDTPAITPYIGILYKKD